MKTAPECAASAAAAMAAYVDDTKAETPEDLGRVATMMISTVCEGLVATLGREFTLQTLAMIRETIMAQATSDGGPSTGGPLQ